MQVSCFRLDLNWYLNLVAEVTALLTMPHPTWCLLGAVMFLHTSVTLANSTTQKL